MLKFGQMVLVLLITVGPMHAQGPLSTQDMKTLHVRIAELKRKESLLDAIVNVDNPAVKACREAKWPDAEDCRINAVAMMRTLQKEYARYVKGGKG